MGFKSGFVGVLGKTNAGKSTLINALLGRKAVIVSDKPQTTRNRIRCILNLEHAQVVLLDTPGLHAPADKLSHYLIQQALSTLDGLDLVLYLVEPWGAVRAHDVPIFQRLRNLEAPKFLVISKVDRAKRAEVVETIEHHAKLELFEEIIPTGAPTGYNLATLAELIVARLPEGPPFFDRDQTTDRPLSFLVAELIREQVFQLTRQEVPYAVAVEVAEIVERGDKPLVEIYAHIDVARNSQRGILIGQRGERVKQIGQRARLQIEALLGTRVFLDLKVRVVKKWNENPATIRRLLGKDN